MPRLAGVDPGSSKRGLHRHLEKPGRNTPPGSSKRGLHRHLEKPDKNARDVLNAVCTVIKKNPLKTPRDLPNAVCTVIWKNQVKPPGSPGFLSHEGWKNQA
jgi:hypothetical protein